MMMMIIIIIIELIDFGSSWSGSIGEVRTKSRLGRMTMSLHCIFDVNFEQMVAAIWNTTEYRRKP